MRVLKRDCLLACGAVIVVLGNIGTVSHAFSNTRVVNKSSPSTITTTLPRQQVLSSSPSPSLALKMSSRNGSNNNKNEDEDLSARMNEAWESLQADLQMRWKIAQASNAEEGSNFKQVMADVLAGEYDAAPIREQIEVDIQSAPVVMYTWKPSPACKSAIKAFEIMLGVTTTLEEQVGEDKVRIIRLDDPWDEGNPIRAQLGKKVGRTSVPCIFIGGKYVGGFDGGVGTEAPGIQAMAFQGTLRPALEAAGLILPPVGKEAPAPAPAPAVMPTTEEEPAVLSD